MAPYSSPNSSIQSRDLRVSPPARKTHLNSPLCGPRFTQHSHAHGPPGSQSFHAEPTPKLNRQDSGAPPISLQTPPQAAHMLGRTPEHLMTRLQGGWLPAELDMSLAQLWEIFPHAFSLPEHGIMGLPYDDSTFSFDLGAQPSHSIPPFDGMGGIQNHMVHMNTAHHPQSYNHAEDTPTDTPFLIESSDAYGVQGSSRSPSFNQSFTVLPDASPRSLGARTEYGGMTISSGQHEAASTPSTTYLPSPTLSADTRLTPSDHPSPNTVLPSQPPVNRANKEEHIRVIDLLDQWRARQTGPFGAASLGPFRAFCVNELIRLGYQDVSRLFSKQPKAIVGTPVSRTDRLRHRLEQTTTNLTCPLSGCGSQCTRRHNLNLHLGAHIGLTDRYCGGCDTYFSASSINRHKDTCSGKKAQRPRRRYGVHVSARN